MTETIEKVSHKIAQQQTQLKIPTPSVRLTQKNKVRKKGVPCLWRLAVFTASR
tara:strand:- start:20229 stop:20387 length:159 start_codon:yes stop_codon:yes gene_type:complete